MMDVAVVGASGYGGGELLRLLARHPDVRLACAISETYAGQPLAASFPGLAGVSDLRFTTYGDGDQVAQCDVVFLAQENGKAMHTAPHLLEAGCKVIDLSADFRFQEAALYETIYKTPHAALDWNRKAIYGLPEVPQYRAQILGASLVGNPGCHATAALLALLPLVENRLVRLDSLVIDSKTGVSGAGRAKFQLEYHFAEINESVSAYNPAGRHRHVPEIEQTLRRVQASDQPPVQVTFTPHLIPITRGILVTCYARLHGTETAPSLLDLYTSYYANAPFVHVVRDGLPATKHTTNTNDCHIGLAVDPRTGMVTVVAALDNLLKGAAGQAVQNMNLLCGLDEVAGLQLGGIWP